MKLGLPISVSIVFWSLAAVARYLIDGLWTKYDHPLLAANEHETLRSQVAICIPAHNEEAVIEQTIASLRKLVPASQMYIVSDGSDDRTAQLAKASGCNVLELTPGRGKASALEALFERFDLLNRYQFLLIADADTVFDEHFLERALAYLAQDPKVSVVTAAAQTQWANHWIPSLKMYYVAYRVRLWRVLGWFLVFGQTWRHLNVFPVIPGYASLYRTSVLKQLKLYVPGLAIEDFNMAFQLHKKKLGMIAYHPRAFATSQDPDNLIDYWNQVKRWNVGYFQTIKKWGIWPSLFWLAQGIFTLEVLSATLSLLILPTVLVLAGLIALPGEPSFGSVFGQRMTELFISALIAFFAIDYAITLFVALKDRKYMLAFYGLGFLFLHYVNSLILLISIPTAFLTEATGRWSSPKRWK